MRQTVLIATHPFGASDAEPLRLLEASGAEIRRNSFGRKLRRDELRDLLRGVVAVVASTETYDAPLLDAARDLKLIARTGVGLDSVDLEAARARGIAVSWTPDGPSDSVAELTVGLMVSLAREVPQADRAIRAGRWERRTGALLGARTVGLVGLGRVGSRVAKLLRAFGASVLATDPDPAVAPRAAELGVALVPLEELLARSEVVSLHVPLTPATRGLFGRETLGRLRPGALLLNTARGEVVDERALLAVLESGHLAGAALDVFAEEPYRGPLAGREDVILTAHMGSCSHEGRRAMELGAARAVLAFLEGRPIPDRVA